jgi:hypothetical protein
VVNRCKITIEALDVSRSHAFSIFNNHYIKLLFRRLCVCTEDRIPATRGFEVALGTEMG